MTAELRAEFLRNACDDTQGTIRAIDQKANTLLPIILLPFPVVAWAAARQWNLSGHRVLLYVSVLLAVVVALAWIFSIIHLLRCLYPRSNPADFVPPASRPEGSYYGADLFPNLKMFARVSSLRSTKDVDQHIKRLPQDACGLVREYALEHIKLVYIRELKIRMMRRCIVSYVTAIVFLGALALVLGVLS